MAKYKNALREGIFKLTQDNMGENKANIQKYANTLTEKLKQSKIKCELHDIVCSPCNTLFKYKLSDDCFVGLASKLKKLQKEIPFFIGMSMVEIKPLLDEPGFGISIPRINRTTIPIGNLLCEPSFMSIKTNTTFVVGINEDNNIVNMDFKNIGNLLVTGTHCTGKKAFLKLLISSVMANAQINTVKFILVNIQSTSLNLFEKCENFLDRPIISTNKEITSMIFNIIDEISNRIKIFKNNGVDNIDEFNKLKAPDNEVMTRIVIVIDELMNFMATNKNESEKFLTKITQLGKETGIHLVCATNTMDTTFFTKLNNFNFQTRLSFKTTSSSSSKAILGYIGANELFCKGDGLYKDAKTGTLKRFQCGYISDEEIEQLIDYIQNRAITD